MKKIIFKSHHFKKLNEIIFHKTGLSLNSKADCNKLSNTISSGQFGYVSVSTLYRIFVLKSKKHNPYKHTLDILCTFAGYKDAVNFFESEKENSKRNLLSYRSTSESLLYYSFKNESYNVLHDYFDSTENISHVIKEKKAVEIFDVLLKLEKNQNFFKTFAKHPFIRKYFFEIAHDPKFRISGYEIGYLHYLKNVKAEQDLQQFQDYIFGNCVLFRKYFIMNEFDKALLIGKLLYEKNISSDELYGKIHLFPLLRYAAYKLWYLHLKKASEVKIYSYAEEVLMLAEQKLMNCFGNERNIVFHTIGEVFTKMRMSSDYQNGLLTLFTSDLKRIPLPSQNKNIEQLLPYFEPNGLLRFRP